MTKIMQFTGATGSSNTSPNYSNSRPLHPSFIEAYVDD
jgi:hypothetical protein